MELGLVLAIVTAVLAVSIVAGPVWGWGPGVHIFLGSEVLGSLSLLPPGVAALLRRFPSDFLYGCIAADITFGKKYAPIGRNCHHWHVGEELYSAARTGPTRACALGYLAHLAADTTAHNFYLPQKLLSSANTQSIGHSYWEHRMDVHLGEAYIQAALELVTEFDHSHSDALFDDVLDRTVFSFRTNRRIFRGMIRLAGHNTWQAFFDRVIELSRWNVEESETRAWLSSTFDYTVDYLVRGSDSVPARLDPTGAANLREARRLRRDLGRALMHPQLERLARQRFDLPVGHLRWWESRDRALGLQLPLAIPGADGPAAHVPEERRAAVNFS